MQIALTSLVDSTDFHQSSIQFFASLGYTSPRTFEYSNLSFDTFCDALGVEIDAERVKAGDWKAIHLLFQFTADELSAQNNLFDKRADRGLFDAFVFVSLELSGTTYSRTQLATIAREINKPFASPVIVLFKHGQTVSLASVARRPNEKDGSKHVLQKVSLLKDIRLEKSHRAHLDILENLSGAKTSAHNWTEFLAAWNRVLDIQELNKSFYRDYKVVFQFVEDAAILSPELETQRRDWTQRLFNRLLFLRFLEKKNWLRFNGDTNYLRALFTASVKKGENDFLNDRLFYAFFFGLGFPSEHTKLHSLENLQKIRGQVPYLNGGLFEQVGDGDVQYRAKLPNEAFEKIFNLFERYYFTVDEATPTEQEIGIDPEMLGKVFEELVTGRHESGSYYTPRGIVSFMGRESLKGYLEACDTPEAISSLVDDGDGAKVSDPERVLEALRNVTICDPACGSGAYLLGMMQELLRLREALFAAKARDHQKIYDRKLEIIAHNLYGVDRDPFAVGIAMLRLWLSLIIEFEGENPPPLPNLKYKIEVGDSLSAPLGSQLTLDSELIKDFNELKAKYVRVHHEEKRVLETQIEEARGQLKLNSSAPDGAHDWRTEFAEVFQNGGFDIVLANPPYVRQELIKDQKPQLRVVFGSEFSGTADLYVFFYLRAWELLKSGGQIAFISPNKWFRAAYGAKLRAHFAAKTNVRHIIDFGELRVFQTAATFPMIFIAEKSESSTRNGNTMFTQVKTLAEPYPDVRALVQSSGAILPTKALDGANWNLSDATTSTRLETMRKSGLPLGEYVKGQIYRGVLTGFNEAFVIDETTRFRLIKADKRSAELIKPMAKGDDVRRWRIEDKKRFLIFTRRGTKINEYPAIKAHLEQWQEQLMPKPRDHIGDWNGRKPGSYKWFEIQDEVAYFAKFETPKIVYPVIAKEPRFMLDNEKRFFNDKAFMIVANDIFLLGILNSSSAWDFFKKTCSVLGDAETGGRVELRSFHVENLPIPNAAATDKSAIESLVESCLKKRGVDCADEEAEINARVAKLYGL